MESGCIDYNAQPALQIISLLLQLSTSCGHNVMCFVIQESSHVTSFFSRELKSCDDYYGFPVACLEANRLFDAVKQNILSLARSE